MARILVVDDEPSIRDLLQTVLTRRGHEVITASTGRNGVARFREDRPGLTILDLAMPDIGGFEVLKQIRTLDQATPVIILTGVGTEEHEAQAKEYGATDFLRKGFSLHALGESLKRALRE
ncbi:response regulator [Nitrospira moscoviensis]|uniref:Putative transcriptional regulator ycf27 n=1 Tax=Nitrospira moscoviensis TaxID=42253 RepID=A0A0K2G794_NITMO|nr:response regulator [Nitrospira moscoviensis]ALA56739.1 putative transcriptional regulator ycf27 [Nitrospira moscoviensis]